MGYHWRYLHSTISLYSVIAKKRGDEKMDEIKELQKLHPEMRFIDILKLHLKLREKRSGSVGEENKHKKYLDISYNRRERG